MKLSNAFLSAVLVLTACGPDEAVTSGDEFGEVDGALGAPLTEVHCSAPPTVGAPARWRHLKSYVIAALSARHRGVDLVGSSSDATQLIHGEATYGLNDKALEDEWVQLFACRSGRWTSLGDALTDTEGRFTVTLTGASRLPSGVRDLFVSVAGDRRSARFTAVVARAGTNVAVTDIDGTLTSSESAFTDSLLSGAVVAAHPNAAAALTTLKNRGFAIVYLTARGRYFTPQTRAWLDANGFPAGALRLAPALVTAPGQPTIDFKQQTMAALPLPVKLGLGNRATDVQAYRAVGVAATRVFAKLPEFSSELQPLVTAGEATAFTDYAQLQATFATF